MAHFLVDASLPRPSGQLIKSYGYDATDVRDIGMGTASDDVIARHAQIQGLAIVARDLGFADIRVYPPDEYEGIVVIRAPDDAGRELVLKLMRGFFLQPDLVSQISRRLAIVETSRIRFRPPL